MCGADQDRFVFEVDGGTIADFTQGDDLIDLAFFSVTFGDLGIADSGGGSSIDVTSGGSVLASIDVNGVVGLLETDFVFS